MTLAQTIIAQSTPTEVLEATLQQAIVELATENGWLVHETANAAVAFAAGAGRWDAVQGTGFPDLVLGRELDRRLLFVECKTQRGRLGSRQWQWRTIIEGLGCDWRLWRPLDYRDGTIAQALR